MTGYEPRKYVIMGVFILFGLLYIGRLFMLQVMDESLKTQASDVGVRTIFPARGLIYDRHGKLIVGNQPIYELLVVQQQVGDMDTTRFCELLGITDSQFVARMQKLRSNPGMFSRLKPEPFMGQIPYETFAQFEEHRHEFPGFYPQVKMVRSYPYGVAAHVVGDIGEVSKREREQSEYYYDLGEFVGKSGLEKQYEQVLRGTKGKQYYLKDNIGRDLGPFRDGAFDTAAVAGANVTTTLDIELQQYGEWLMQNKRGSIVAIEPATGEILAFISSPAYDPNLLVGRIRGENFTQLLKDTVNKPLVNRPLTALYPPGSTFKPLMGLMAVEENAIRLNTYYPCNSGYLQSGVRVGCHAHESIDNLNEAIQHSCNAYFCNALRQFLESDQFADESVALDKWADYLSQFGLGKKTGIDLPGEYSGNIPRASYFDKLYEGWRWKAITVISLSIGQGEITTTPIQIANMYAALANEGSYFRPHLVKDIDNDTTNLLADYRTPQTIDIDPKYFHYVLDGMAKVVTDGTARLARIDSIEVCGKTGTAENPHGEDHSLFSAFAPKEQPKIAIAVVVENSGFGGTWAAPIASLMMEYYLKRSIPENRKWLEKRMVEADFIHVEEVEG